MDIICLYEGPGRNDIKKLRMKVKDGVGIVVLPLLGDNFSSWCLSLCDHVTPKDARPTFSQVICESIFLYPDNDGLWLFKQQGLLVDTYSWEYTVTDLGEVATPSGNVLVNYCINVGMVGVPEGHATCTMLPRYAENQAYREFMLGSVKENCQAEMHFIVNEDVTELEEDQGDCKECGFNQGLTPEQRENTKAFIENVESLIEGFQGTEGDESTRLD